LIVFLSIEFFLVFNVLSASFENLKRKATYGDVGAQFKLAFTIYSERAFWKDWEFRNCHNLL